MRAVAALMLSLSVVLAVALGACAEDPRVLEERAKAEAAAARPWEPARVVLDSAVATLKAGGIRAIEPQVFELETALAKAPEAIAKARSEPNRVWLVDGLPEMMGAALQAGPANAGAAPPPSVLENPYPLISMILGSYYVEMRRPDDALRVLEAGLALPPAVPGLPRSMVPALSAERANALGLMGRWQDALVAWERALRLPELRDPVKARILRGRGVALIELKRLNEAEQSFRSALALEPGNASAQNELAYIAALRAGRPAVKPDLRTGTPPTQP